jgi:hypothetical protein
LPPAGATRVEAKRISGNFATASRLFTASARTFFWSFSLSHLSHTCSDAASMVNSTREFSGAFSSNDNVP